MDEAGANPRYSFSSRKSVDSQCTNNSEKPKSVKSVPPLPRIQVEEEEGTSPRPETVCVPRSTSDGTKKEPPKVPSRNSLSSLSPPNFEKKNRKSLKYAFTTLRNSFSGIYT